MYSNIFIEMIHIFYIFRYFSYERLLTGWFIYRIISYIFISTYEVKNITPHKPDKCVSREMKGWNLPLRIFCYSFAEVVKCFQGRTRSIHRRNWTCLTRRQNKEEKKHCNCTSIVFSLLYSYFCHFYLSLLSRKNFQFQDYRINCLFS